MSLTWAQFWADKGRLPLFGVVLRPETTAGAVDPWYLSTPPPLGDLWSTEPGDTPPNQPFLPIVENVGAYQLAALDPQAVGRSGELHFEPLAVINRFGELDGATGRNSWRDLRWRGRDAEVWLGGYSPLYGAMLPWSEWQPLQTLEMDGVFVGRARAEVRFRDPGERLRSHAVRHKFGEFGYSCDLKGVASVSFGAASKLNLRNDLSIQARLYLNAAGSMSRLVGHDGATYPFRVQIPTSRAIRFYDSSGTIDVTTTATLSLKRWYQLLVRLVGSSLSIGIWDEAARTEVLETFTVSTATRPTSAGTFWHSFSAQLVDGILDEVAIASTPVSLSAWRRRRERRLSDAEVIGYVQVCRYDDGILTTVADSASSPVNGTISGAGAWVPSLHGMAGSGIEGQTLPDPVGPVFGFTPILVDEARAIYCVSVRPVLAIDAVYDGAAAIPLGTAYTDLRIWQAATTLADRYDPLITALGTWIRLGTPEQLSITVDVRGDASGSGYVSAAGDVISRLVQTRGARPLTSGEVSSADVAVLNLANPNPVGMSVDGSVEDCVTFIGGSVGAAVWFDEARQLRMQRIESIKTDATWQLLYDVDRGNVISVEALEGRTPVWEWVIQFRRNHTVLTPEQIAGSQRATAAGFAARTEWRRRRRYADEVLEADPHAERRRRQTGFATAAHAEAEGDRLLELWQFGWEAFAVETTFDAMAFEPLWSVGSLEMHELGRSGERIARFGLGSPTLFYLVSKLPRPTAGTCSLVLARPRDE